MPQSIILLSGGLDSTVSAYESSHPILALTFDYGQRAAKKEIEAAKKTADRLSIPQQIIPLPWLKEVTTTSLVNLEKPIPYLKNEELDKKLETLSSAAQVWVPNRNGLFINIAACIAEAMNAQEIVAAPAPIRPVHLGG